MNRLVVTKLFVAAALSLVVAACGDDDSCPSQVVVAFASPTDGMTITMDASAAPGVQVDIRARSNLKEGATFSLSVTTASGQVATYDATSDSNGDVVFQSITLPAGTLTLEVSGTSSCGTGSDSANVIVLGDSECVLAVREGPIPNEYYNLPVLNTTNDSDGNLPGFQANIDVTSLAGATVELFVFDLDGTAQEVSAGEVTADGSGVATFPITLGQGRQAVRATCVSAAFDAASATQTLMIDTEAPACDLSPGMGTTIIPALDEDNATAGTQVTLTGTAVGTDVEGEASSFTIGAQVIDTTLDAAGTSTTVATFSSPSPPPTGVVFTAHDHAGNACTAMVSYDVDLEGCSIVDMSTTLVTTDSDGNPANGLQGEIVVNVETDCVGQTATTTCDVSGSASATVPGDGRTTIPVTLCATGVCETVLNCQTSVTDVAGNVTTAPVTITVDNRAPTVALQFVNPVTSCGSALTAAADVDPVTPGVQIDVRVVSPLAATRWVEVTNGATATTPATAGGDARITLQLGTSNVVAFAEDQYSNQSNSGACDISLADIGVTFTTPIADGYVNASESTGSGGAVTFDLCGTTSEPVDTVDVVIDGMNFSAVVNGTTWCASVTLAESATPYMATATATITASGRDGLANALFTVDVTGPNPPTNLVVTTPTRQSARMEWTAPGDGGAAVDRYIVKRGSAAFTEGNFDGTGTLLTPPTPSAPGGTDAATASSLQTGTEYYFAVAAVDPAGNRSTIAAGGPVTPVFDQTGAFRVPNVDAGELDGFGFSVVRGRFNNDPYWDLAISAPYQSVYAGKVYVFLGSATGIDTSAPSFIIEHTGAGAQFGTGLAAIRWDGDALHDLAISAPFADRVFIFNAANHFDTGMPTTINSANASVTIMPAAGGRYDGSGLGYALASARFDNDSLDDLVMTNVTSNGFTGVGGVTVLYGGTTGNVITLDGSGGTGTAIAHYIPDPAGALNLSFGYWAFNLGRTQGAGDSNDDISVAALCRDSVYVLRGGAAKPAVGDVVTRTYSATTDLEIVDDSGQTCGATFPYQPYFGLTMGSIADLNADGARDIVIGSYKWSNTGARETENGRVMIVDGNAVGTQTIGAPGAGNFTITALVGANGERLGHGIANNALAATSPDVNGDGAEDLVVTSGIGVGNVRAKVWFGGAIPVGTSSSSSSASHVIAMPNRFDAQEPTNGDTPIALIWAGDVNGDGFEDLCVADHRAAEALGAERDGLVNVLWDDGM